jgi:hypothetical protein
VLFKACMKHSVVAHAKVSAHYELIPCFKSLYYVSLSLLQHPGHQWVMCGLAKLMAGTGKCHRHCHIATNPFALT